MREHWEKYLFVLGGRGDCFSIRSSALPIAEDPGKWGVFTGGSPIVMLIMCVLSYLYTRVFSSSRVFSSLVWKVLVTQSFLNLCDPMDYTPLRLHSVHGIGLARILEWISIPFSRVLPDPGFNLGSCIQADSLMSEPEGAHFGLMYTKYVPRLASLLHCFT